MEEAVIQFFVLGKLPASEIYFGYLDLLGATAAFCLLAAFGMPVFRLVSRIHVPQALKTRPSFSLGKQQTV